MKQYFHSKWTYVSRFAGIAAGIGALILVAPAVQAQVLVTGFYSQVGTNFNYNFQVKNQTSSDVSVVELLYNVGSPATLITNVTTVPGFTFDVDSVTGAIDFAENTSFFAANTTVSGFQFTSSRLLDVTSTSGLNSDGSPFTGSFTTVAVPEASALSLGLLAGSALIGTIIIRRRSVA